MSDSSSDSRLLDERWHAERVREPGHRMFRTPARDVHLHIWPSGRDEEHRHLLFRDWLRHHPSDRQAYEALKRNLAGWWPDMNYYAEAKGDMIERILVAANRAHTTSS